MFIFVHSADDLISYALIMVSLAVGNNFINFIHLRKYFKWKDLEWKKMNIVRHIKPTLQIYLPYIITNIYGNLNIVMIGFMQSDAAVGIYTAANKLTFVVLTVVTSLSVVLLPRCSNLIEKGNLTEFKHISLKSSHWVIATALPAATGMMLLADPLVRLFCGSAFGASAEVVYTTAPVILLIGLSNVIGIQIFYPENKAKFVIFSTLGGAIINMLLNFALIPHLSIVSQVDGRRELPEVLFQLEIPAIMNVMSALALSLMVGLAITWTKSKMMESLLDEVQNIVLAIVTKIIIPILPFFIASTFCGLAYEGTITKQFPVFIKVIIIVMIGHYIWMAVRHGGAGAYSCKNPIVVVKHDVPAYITAVVTMSSAATLAGALRCAKKSTVLRKDMVNFGIPLFANIHLFGTVTTEVFFVMTISPIPYGKIPSVGTMILFCVLLGIFAIGAPGVPGGTVMASLGLITGILLFDGTGTALMLTIFALQASFGTACNVTGDGALTLILTGYANKHHIAEEKREVEAAEVQ